MNILIKNMKMPKSCYECKLDLRKGACSAFCEWKAEHKYSIRATDRLPDCPLSEAPDPSVQQELPFEIQDILDYLDTVLHPIISPEHWNVYSELYDMISMLIK